MSQNFFVNVQSSLSNAALSVLTSIVSYLPTLLAALIVFVIGLVLANWLKKMVVKLLNLLHLSEVLGMGGLKQFLANADITQKIESVIGQLVRYLVILIFSVASINLLGLNTVTQVLNGLLGYLPNILAAVLILGAGVVLAGFLEKVVKGSLGGIDLRLSRLMAKTVSYLIVIFAALAAISQLGIAKNFIDTLFVGFVGMLALALGLALGLGSKDLVKDVLDNWYKDLKKDLK
jgi:small-conductance mechanosensitive channel